MDLRFITTFALVAGLPIAAIVLISQLLAKTKTALQNQIDELSKTKKSLETALFELEKKTSEISILYESAARGVFPLSQFVSRLAETTRTAVVEILAYEKGEEKSLAAFGYPAPEIPPAATLEIPLLQTGQKIGLLRLLCYVRKEFSADEKRMVSIIADRLTHELVHQKMESQRRDLEQKLRDKVAELEEFNKLAVGRELKMIEQEKEIEELKRRPGAT